ncbi:MAG: YceH family protein [Planctomycetaceae bacterium]
MNEENSSDVSPIRELSKRQRRVLGVLLEKAFTTPEYYPLTLKAVTTGCNQKSNRVPVVSYDEETVSETLEQLAELGLVGIVHTESGRTERYRHYMRHKFNFTEPQLAILTELWLRGRQQLGELRSRAGRMVPIESLNDLREELRGLLADNYILADGSLDRRGVEVDHNFYTAAEAKRNEVTLRDTASADESREIRSPEMEANSPVPHWETANADQVSSLEQEIQNLRGEVGELRHSLAESQEQIRQLEGRFDELRRDLGG